MDGDLRRRVENLKNLERLLIEARIAAATASQALISYLIDMALIEAAEQIRLHDLDAPDGSH